VEGKLTVGYFSNGSEGQGYMEHYCYKCVNWRDNGSGSEGCPIIDLHLLWNYEAIGKGSDGVKSTALNHFIPREGPYNGECTMFQLPPVPSQRELERLGQMRLLG
jgi:hypothetical protein